MKSLSDATSRVTQKNFSRKFVSIGRIVKSWNDIMGPAFSDKATPSRILYRKPKTKKDPPVAILEIATTQADSMLITYQKDVILQRMEHLFGERWITDIKFISAPRNKLHPKPDTKDRPLTPQEENNLVQMLDTVSDPLIYERLKALGEGILRKSSHPRRP